MQRMIRISLFVVLVGMISAGTAFAFSNQWNLPCRKNRTGEEIGKVTREVTADGKVNKSPAELVLECNEKYANECAGQCWLCQNKGGVDAVFNTCWGPDGECVGADCGAWR